MLLGSALYFLRFTIPCGNAHYHCWAMHYADEVESWAWGRLSCHLKGMMVESVVVGFEECDGK